MTETKRGYIQLTPEMLEYLTGIRAHMKIDASDAVARGLCALLEQLTQAPLEVDVREHTKTYQQLMQNVEFARGYYESNAVQKPFIAVTTEEPKKPSWFDRVFAFLCSPAGY